MRCANWKPVFLLVSLAGAGTSAYVWPSPYDFLEDAYTVSSGFADGGIVDGVNPCSLAPINGLLPGREAASEWLRLAYHDMATYDTETGLGGPSDSKQTDRRTVILAIKNCGGPSIPFRAGRIDAEVAGPETVPEPQQDLASHTASFARQGFNLTEMIGHTVGGVHQVDFPLSIENAITSSNPDGVVHFDDTVDSFDNHIAAQWIDGTSIDPLAVGFNETTNSDARIFAADGNQTMRAFAQDPDFFSSQCGSLLERMLNTVPKAVQLSEVIEPLPVKPYELVLSLATNGTLIMTGYIRIFGTSAEAVAASPAGMPVTLTWLGRNGETNASYSTSAASGSSSSGSLWGSVHFFEVSATIDAQAGISSFVVDWAYSAQDALTHSDNDGAGFSFQDVALYQADKSCSDAANGITTAYAVIRNDMGPLTAAYIDYTTNVNQQGSPSNNSPRAHHSCTATFSKGPFTDEGRITFDVVAVIAGETYVSLNNPEIFTMC
ncbi:WSC domain-containing protein [Mycena latifolia]|nr:WSC domain-containing protein [Mycena latifolia]